RAMLTDFGSGTYPDASPLTPPAWHPGTPAYRSPEAALLELYSPWDHSARHAAGPADDLYSLGVTACRLLTGEYPQPGEFTQDEHGTWHAVSVFLPPALHQVEPKLRAIILRLLSVRPEERGTAAEWAQALEQSAPRQEPNSAERVRPRASAKPWWPALKVAAAGVALAAWLWWLAPSEPVEQPSMAQRGADGADRPDGGTSGLGEAASTTSMEDSPPLSLQERLAEEPLPEPEPEQTRPDAKGRCPHKQQVALNGGCWAPLKITSEECEAADGQMFKDQCYVPVFAHGRRHPTSHRAPKP
ncbi:MAG: serine/threonine protein kinase, partial [Hyalangium sp.]